MLNAMTHVVDDLPSFTTHGADTLPSTPCVQGVPEKIAQSL